MFVKLFTSMFDGTLATKGPWQAVVTFQQMLILCDRAGIIDMTPEAISRRTTIPLDIIEIGIAALEAPDPASRRPDEEGRRILKLSDTRDWGWQIVNYSHYRALRTAEERREYQRNLMRERRAQAKPATLKRAPLNGAFDAFWQAYPRRVGRAAAEKVWLTINPDEPLQDRILSAVMAQAKSEQWTKEGGQFIPHASTWLRGKRWDDDLSGMPEKEVNPLYAGPGRAVM